MPDESNPSAPALPIPPPPAGCASNSDWPRRSKHFQPEPGGIYASNKVWGAILGTLLTILTGGATYGGWQLVTRQQLDESISEAKAEQAVVNEEVSDKLTSQGEAIVVVTAKVGQVREVQNLDIAHRESRRVVDEVIKCRRTDDGCQDRRDREVERIRQLNMKRLEAEKPRPPCADLACRD